MSSDLKAGLVARRESLLSEISALQESLAADTQRLRRLQLTLESVLELLRMEGAAADDEMDWANRHFLEVAHDVLLEKGALHYKEIAAELANRRSFVPGAKPEANLLTHIARDDRFVRVGRGRYGLKQWHEDTKDKASKARRR